MVEKQSGRFKQAARGCEAKAVVGEALMTASLAVVTAFNLVCLTYGDILYYVNHCKSK